MTPLLHEAVEKAIRQAFSLGKQVAAHKRPEHQMAVQAIDYAHAIIDHVLEEEVRRGVQAVIAAANVAP